MDILAKGRGKKRQIWICRLMPGDKTAENATEPLIDIRNRFFNPDQNSWLPTPKGFRMKEVYVIDFIQVFDTFAKLAPSPNGNVNFSALLLDKVNFLMLNNNEREPCKEIRICTVPMKENITEDCREGQWTDYWKGKHTDDWFRKKGITTNSEKALELNKMLQSLASEFNK